MAVAMIGRPSWPDRPALGHNPQGRYLPDRAQPDQGPAQEAIGEMAWLLRDTRSSVLLGGGVLSAITIAIGLEAAFSGHAVRPGVVKLSCGAWYDPAGDDDNAACAHGNANVLTRDHGTSRLGQGPSSATALVEIERWVGAAPPVRAFVPPEMAEDATA